MTIDIYAQRPTRSGVYSMPRTGTKSTVVCDLPCVYHGLSFVAELWMREVRKDGSSGIEIEASLPKGVSFGPPTSAETRAFRKMALRSAMTDVQYRRWEADATKRLVDAINGVGDGDLSKPDENVTKRIIAFPKPAESTLVPVTALTVAPVTGHPATDTDKAEAAADGNTIDTSVLTEEELETLTDPTV